MLVKIPFNYYQRDTSVDWDELGIEEPEPNDEDLKPRDAYINPNNVYLIEPDSTHKGWCLISMSNVEDRRSCPISAEKASMIINQIEK